MAVSISACEDGLKIIDAARRKKGWTKYEETWFHSATTSEATLKRFWRGTSISQETFIAICKQVGVDNWESIVTPPPAANQTPPALSVYNPETWVGRSTIIDELLPKLQDKTRLFWIIGIPGIGKTTLGECLASRAWESNPTFQWVYLEVLEGQGADFTTVAADLLAKLGDRDFDPQERNDPKRLTDRLVRKLQSSFYWVQLDSLERLLNPEQGSAFADTYWVTFLQRCLTEQDFASRLVLTAQALPSVLGEFRDRYPNAWEAKILAGLSANEPQNEHLEFFRKHGVAVDEENQAILSKLGQVYEGHALVLQVMSGEIQADFAGDAARYWAVNQQEFEQVARSLDAKRLDETEYNDELDRRVRDRVKKSLQQLPPDAQDLLFRSSVYCRPVPKKFWLAMIDDRLVNRQKEAYRVLSDRSLIEKESTDIRQHNLIRAIAYDLLKANIPTWHAVECQAAHLWFTAYKPVPDAPNLDTVRGYLEAFDHYCEAGAWDTASEIYTYQLPATNQALHWQLVIWGYYRELMAVSRRLVDQITSQTKRLCLNQIGNSYKCLGDSEKSIDYYQQALKFTRETGDRAGEGGALGNLGNAYENLGQYERAIDCNQQSLTIMREIGNRQNEGTALGSLGNVYNWLGQYERTISFHQQHLMIAQEIGDRAGEGNALANMGATQLKLEQYPESLTHNQTALEILQEIGYREGEAHALKNLAELHQALGEIEEARQYCQQALALATELSIPLADECRTLQEEIEDSTLVSSG